MAQNDIAVADQEADLFFRQQQMPIEAVHPVKLATVKVIDEPVLALEQPNLKQQIE